MMTDETLICPEFDGLWSAKAPSSGPLSPGEGEGGLVGSEGGGGVREDGQGHKLTMSKMEKVCGWVCALMCLFHLFFLFHFYVYNQDILQRNLQKQKETITHAQVVAGREFKASTV